MLCDGTWDPPGIKTWGALSVRPGRIKHYSQWNTRATYMLSLEGEEGSVVQISDHSLGAQNMPGAVLKHEVPALRERHWWANCKGINLQDSVTFSSGGPSQGIETKDNSQIVWEVW